MTALAEIISSTPCLCSAYAVPVADKPRGAGNTPNRVIRISEEDWELYGRACEALGSTRSDDIRRHVKAINAAFLREERRIARESADS